MKHLYGIRILALSGAVLFGAACGGGESGDTTQAGAQLDAQVVQAGQQIFTGEGTCFTCHGANGEGIENMCPNLTDDEWLNIAQPVTIDKIKQVITSGVMDQKRKDLHPTVMPPMGHLGDEKITALATYVYSLSQE